MCIDCQPNSANCVGTSQVAMEYVTCDASGAVVSRVVCNAGCDDQASNAVPDGCLDIDPRNCLAPYLDMASTEPAFVLTGQTTFNTDTGQVTNSVSGSVSMVSSIVDQPSCPTDAVRVFMVGSLGIENAQATGSHAMALVSNGDLTISGHFSVSAVGTLPGPAGRTAGVTCLGATGQIGTATEGNAGSGGGSFAGAGGRGGNISTATPLLGGSPGVPIPNSDTFELEPLLGGCRGGMTAGTLAGGGAGGAVQIVSRTRIFLDAGSISANGGGGGVEGSSPSATDTSAGGGSGGGILVEAPVVEGSGGAGLYANGGAGGCIDTTGTIVHAGQDGPLAANAAQGASCMLLTGSSSIGGSGGFGTSSGGAGSDETPGSGSRAGGGGGGTGFIQVDAHTFDAAISITRSPPVQSRAMRTRPQAQ